MLKVWSFYSHLTHIQGCLTRHLKFCQYPAIRTNFKQKQQCFKHGHACTSGVTGTCIPQQRHLRAWPGAQIPWRDCEWWHTACGVMKLMWLRSISDKSQAAQFYTCRGEQMVLGDNVAGGGSLVEQIQRGDTGSSGAQERGEKWLRCYVILIHITCTGELFPDLICVMNS